MRGRGEVPVGLEARKGEPTIAGWRGQQRMQRPVAPQRRRPLAVGGIQRM